MEIMPDTLFEREKIDSDARRTALPSGPLRQQLPRPPRRVV